jgi:hypothetical protein
MIGLACLATSCGEDDPNPVDIIIGTWTLSTYDLDITVGTKSLYDYLKTELGLTDADAQQYEAQTRADYEQAVFQKIDFARSGFWTVTDSQGTSRGTWLLSSDAKTLTLDKGKPTEVIFQVANLSAGSMDLVTESSSDVEFNDTMKYRLELKMVK